MSLLSELLPDLEDVRLEVGPKPDEGQWQVLRAGERMRDGAGYTTGGEVVAATYSGRVQYIGHLNRGEREKIGIVRADGEYVISLEAFASLRNTDVLREKAMSPLRSARYRPGMKVQVGDRIYLAISISSSAGMTAASEPVWPVKEDQTVTDGDVTWRLQGKARVLQVVELFDPSTFGDYISKRALCRMRQL